MKKETYFLLKETLESKIEWLKEVMTICKEDEKNIIQERINEKEKALEDFVDTFSKVW